MSVEPVLAELLARSENLDLFPKDGPEPIAVQREAAIAAHRALFAPLGETSGADVADVRDLTVPSPAGDVRVRVYLPFGEPPFPALVYMHGGAWWLGSVEMSDLSCRDLAAGTSAVVVSVDYHLAPEHRYPVALDDCSAALRWTSEHAAQLGVDASRIAIGGVSAGANLAAATALVARDRGGPALCFQLLLMPCLDARCDSESMRLFSSGYGLSRRAVRAAWQAYLGEPSLATDPHASPSMASDLSGLPATMIVTAECDPLRDEAEIYGRRLLDAGVPAVVHRYPRVIHGFQVFTKAVPQARQCRADVIREVTRALSSPATARR